MHPIDKKPQGDAGPARAGSPSTDGLGMVTGSQAWHLRQLLPPEAGATVTTAEHVLPKAAR